MSRLQFELLRLEIKKFEHICRVTRRTHKKSRFKSKFQMKLNDAKFEARHHLLVLCFFKGTPYRRVEHSCRVPPNVWRLRNLIFNYGKEDMEQPLIQGNLPKEWETKLHEWLFCKGD